jgi:predicted DNA-binding transcriptional regulator AlpA
MRMDESQQDFTLLTEHEAARRLAVSPHALRFWRAHGKGPPWLRIGERLIRYDLSELRRWISQQAAVRPGQ